MRKPHSRLKDQVAFIVDQTIRTRKIQTMSHPIRFIYLYCMESKDVKCTFSPNLSDALQIQRGKPKRNTIDTTSLSNDRTNPRRFVDGGWWIAFDPNYVSFARMLPNLQEIDTIKWRITCICLRNVAVYNVWAFATCFGTTDMVTESRCRRKCKWKWFSIIQVLVGSRGSDSPCCDANDSLHDSTRYKLVKWSSCNFLPRKIKHLLSL